MATSSRDFASVSPPPPDGAGPSLSPGHGRPWSREGVANPQAGKGFVWDWTLVLVAVLITGADALYFFALKQPDALLSVISVVRRASVLVSFILGALIFKEGNVRAKAFNMLLMAAGVILLLLGS
ncbi:MAG: hypothetical protein J6Z44_06165 [Bacteroidales bacterium]|nr:hypothetical protein [Bacteroidales bacterium]